MDLELVILTLNCWGILGISKDRKPRMAAIAKELLSGNYDFVFLQEVWVKSDYEFIAKQVSSVLPYSYYFHSGVINGGICVFSKAPFIDTFFHQWSLNGYFHKIQHGDWFGGKGVGICTVKYKGLQINLYTAHFHAEYDRENDEYQAHRVAQAFETAQMLRYSRHRADLSIFAGDFNTEPGDLPYRVLLYHGKLTDSFAASGKPEDEGMTNETPENSYTCKESLIKFPKGKRIDYVMYSSNENFKKRHRADDETNHRQVEVLRDGNWLWLQWQQVNVGDIVRVRAGSFFPADLLLISSSEPQSLCYIETANLDGETNLKIRQSLPSTANLLDTAALSNLNGFLQCELPNRHLYEFAGTLRLDDKVSVPLGPDQILLRGARLQNTRWVAGMVLYTGHETKLMQNSAAAAPLKRSTVDEATNRQILLLFFILVFLCLLASIFNEVWTSGSGFRHWYLGLEDLPTANFGYNLLTFIILFNNLIPISLQVTIEVVRFIQATFINNDLEMYHEATDTPAAARTSNLNEELGQVKYVFSDKTGTLTQNLMEFRECSVGGICYKVNGDSGRITQHPLLDNLTSSHPSAPYIQEFFTLLAVCHTVIPEQDPNNPNTINYHAASPDERALVQGAARLGWVLSARTPETIQIKAQGVPLQFQLLHVLEFTSDRKRMSVIVRTSSGKIKLYCKGADTVIYERLGSPSSQQQQPFIRQVTTTHLENFAREGLRTLCCAVAEIPEDVYDDWKNTYYRASTSLQNREEKLSDAANLIENNLVLLGATAIEDKLQEGVPETIAALLEADIRVWMLTGDKQETAINIGHACRLIEPNMGLIVFNETNLDATRQAIGRWIHAGQLLSVESSSTGESPPDSAELGPMALVVDGSTLRFAMSCELKKDFVRLCLACKAVICCRVSPSQKAEIVDAVTHETQSVTLAIGDGANDVAMIQKANVGVGISGVEGLQAACASDYSIAQFRFLRRLLFVHGACNYYRMCRLILYSFYKNITLYVMELWFALYSAWSGQILFERWTIGLYNVFFTALPPLALGLFDRRCLAEVSYRYPQLYKPSQSDQLFNVKVFWMWTFKAVFHSMVLFWLPLLTFHHDIVWSSGRDGGYLILGNAVYTYVVVTVCLKAALETNTWTWPSLVAIGGSVLMWFFFLGVYSHFWPSLPIAANMAWLGPMLLSSPIFWFGLILAPATALLGDFSVKTFMNTLFKTYTDEVCHKEIQIQRSESGKLLDVQRRESKINIT
nr:EOG090X00X3 [Eulimnadia texana]